MKTPCRDYESDLVELARGADLDAQATSHLGRHLAECPTCGLRLAQERRLTVALRAVAGAAEASSRSAAIEEDLLRAFARQAGPHPRRAARLFARARPGPRRWLAAAAAVILAVVLGQGLARRRAPSPPELPAASEELAFVTLPAAVGLPPFESGRIVRVELPVAVLPAYGLEVAPGPPGGVVEADVLVGQDELPRAIRFVNSASNQGSTR
ncbi:MAG: hypothetical protein AB1806_11620 [Acidobacteriota bacterium]